MEKSGKKRILHVITGLKTGGAETMLTTFLENNKSEEFEHIVCSVYSGGELENRLKNTGITIINLNISNKIFIPLAFIKFSQVVHKIKPDIIQSYLFLDNILARAVGKIFGKKIICGKRNAIAEHSSMVNILDRITLNLADIVVSNFNDGLTELKSWNFDEKKLVYIPNAKDISKFKILLSKNEAKKKLGYDNKTILIGYIANFIWYKGHENLVYAMGSIVNYNPACVLLLIGEGKRLNDIKSLVNKLGLEKNVVFLGKRNDIPIILNALDVYVSSSLYEGMPGAIMEAMACGLPCVTTEAGGTKDLIKNYDNGILVPVKSSKQLAISILELIKDENLAKKLGNAAKETISNSFTIEKMVNSYNDLYKKLTE